MLSTSGHSFELLCLPFRCELLKFARRLTANDALAEDLVQDAYVRALGAWVDFLPDGLDPERAARAWLYRIVANRHNNAWRDHALHRRLALHSYTQIVSALYGEVDNVPLRSTAIVDDHESAPYMRNWLADLSVIRGALLSRRLPRNDQLNDLVYGCENIADEILDAISKLSPKRREAITRYYFRGESCETIGVALHASAGTVSSILNRAREKLAPLLERYARVSYGLGSARVDPHVEAPKRSKPKARCIDRIVAKPHRRTLRRVQLSPDNLASRTG
jgi:RNA polymerase sigma factor (sigma-70 family)